MSEIDHKEKYNLWMGWWKPSVVLGIIALLVAILFFSIPPGFAPKLDSKATHYAVALTNGLMLYGHPEKVTRGVAVLTDVYYVARQTNPQTHEMHNTLISRRKNEWHSPDRMIINTNNILLMEPVDPASSVAKLISEQKKAQ